jgi:hypothetical protein
MIRRVLVATALAATALVALPAGPAQARACSQWSTFNASRCG